MVKEHQHKKKGKRANKWLYQNTNNIIAGTTGKETQSEILLGKEEEKKQVLLHFCMHHNKFGICLFSHI